MLLEAVDSVLRDLDLAAERPSQPRIHGVLPMVRRSSHAEEYRLKRSGNRR